MTSIQISELPAGGDGRGISLAMPHEALEFVGEVEDVHVSSCVPGAVRGNHYHLRKRRAILVSPGVGWSLHWDQGEGTAIHRRNFDGRHAILVLIQPGASHAVRNDGNTTLWLVACSAAPYDSSEVIARKVV
jgi:oxalate decarboxylase/phosphoglucose isomerase-like protein (cupin superfamily)